MAQYVVGLDSALFRLTVWKTTGDPTTLSNWSAQDRVVTFKIKVHSIWAVLDGTDIHVITAFRQRTTATAIDSGFSYDYSKFDTTTDTWSIPREHIDVGNTVPEPTSAESRMFCSIGVRSDGDVVVMYQDQANLVAYARRESGTWTIAITIAISTGVTGGVVVKGASDRMHFFWTHTEDSDIFHRSLSSTNVFDTVATVDAAATALEHPIGRGISYADNGNTIVKVPYIDADESITSIRFTSGANPTISTDTAASDNDVEDINESIVACYAIDGTETQLLYSGGGVSGVDQDIFYDTQADGGSWGTDTEEQDAVTANRLSAGVYERSGTKLGYLWLDGTTTDFDEIALAAPADPIPDRLYDVNQAINRASTY